jgi:hypothetical protein
MTARVGGINAARAFTSADKDEHIYMGLTVRISFFNFSEGQTNHKCKFKDGSSCG